MNQAEKQQEESKMEVLSEPKGKLEEDYTSVQDSILN